MATPTEAKRTIVWLMVLTVGATTVKSIVDASPDAAVGDLFQPRIVIGGVIVTFLLLAAADRAPRVASGMALVTALTAIFVWRDPNRIGSQPAGRVLAGVLGQKLKGGSS